MCPDKQILSIYVDKELPSPWNEKLEAHLESCPACAQNLEELRQLGRIIRNDAAASLSSDCTEQNLLDAKKRIWQKLAKGTLPKDTYKRSVRTNTRIWQRRLSIPLPAAAAAVIVITLITVMTLRNTQNGNNAMAEADVNTGTAIAAETDMPGIIPAADLNDVLRYFSSDSTDIIILTLPESQNFYRTGEPGIIRAADYNRTDGSRR